jgi:hypothetical protein
MTYQTYSLKTEYFVKFDAILDAVAHKHATNWQEVFASPLFVEEVMPAISEFLGYNADECASFRDWEESLEVVGR